MKIILRFVLKNIAEKKLRTCLIVFSIMMSAALFFASSAISTTMENMFMDMMRGRVGDAHLVIVGGEQQESPFFRELSLQELGDELNFNVGVVQSGALYRHTRTENFAWTLRGTDLEDMQSMTPVVFADDSNLLPFMGRKVILGQHTAEAYGLEVGDALELIVAGSTKRFHVAAIAQSAGPFRDDGQNPLVIVPREAASAVLDVPGQVNVQYISLTNPERTDELLAELTAAYPRHSVREALPRSEATTMANSISTPFMMLTMVVLAVSAFIIYTSFKLIAKERLPVIGTFRSIGATRRMTGAVMIAESLVYGVLGGGLGCLLGLGVLRVMSVIAKPQWMQGVPSTASFTPVQLFTAFLVAVVVSFASSALPIKKAAGIPLKDIILGDGEQGKKIKKSRNHIYAAVLVVLALFLPPVLPREVMVLSSGAGMLFGIIAIILAVPFLTATLVRLFEKAYGAVFGNEGLLAVMNLRQNTSILNSISLLALGISSLLVVNTISFSVVREVSNVFTRNVNFEITIQGSGLDRRTLSRVAAVEGVTDVYGDYFNYGLELHGLSGNIHVHVPTSEKFFEFNTNMGITKDYGDLLAELNAGRNIIITHVFKEFHGLALGDTLSIGMRSGTRDYTIVGFIDTIMDNGNFALIGERYHKLDMRPDYFQAVAVKVAGSQQETAKRLKEALKAYSYEIHTMEEWEERNMASNKQMFDILKGFSVLTLVIGIFGVLNNLFISFIERKRALAVLRSVGMSRRQIIKMIFIESLSGGVIGGIVGVLGAVLMLSIMPYFLKATSAPIPISYSGGLLVLSLLAGVFIMITASVSPALKSSRLNIVEALKYE